MGPFTLLDYVGLDTTLYIADILFDEFKESRFAAPTLLRQMVAAGYLGRKTGRGFYNYSAGEQPPAQRARRSASSACRWTSARAGAASTWGRPRFATPGSSTTCKAMGLRVTDYQNIAVPVPRAAKSAIPRAKFEHLIEDGLRRAPRAGRRDRARWPVPAGAGRRPLDRHGHRRWVARCLGRRGRAVDRCPRRHQHARNDAERQRPRHAGGGAARQGRHRRAAGLGQAPHSARAAGAVRHAHARPRRTGRSSASWASACSP